jgi:thymidylate synthase (FAD)
LNPALTRETVAGVSDLTTIWQGQGNFAENVIEYAGRVCYRSTQRMGTAPDFIAARVREGHEDIIEHVVVTLRLTETEEPLRWRMVNRHCEVSELGNGEWIVSGNLRVWRDFFSKQIGLDALPLVRSTAPAVFNDFACDLQEHQEPEVQPVVDARLLSPMYDAPMRVTLLGFTQPLLPDTELRLHHGSAIFLFEGISRACTHQLVRHRLGSFSQESQRYLDLSKGGWKAIVPPVFTDKPEARAVLDDFWAEAEAKYTMLRGLGVRKEDARFLLPNAAETRIVTTMNFDAWSHFLWLRAVDKAAQWEIRAMGQHALKMLYAVAPDVFDEQWRVYQRDFSQG